MRTRLPGLILRLLTISAVLCLCAGLAQGQVIIEGTVYDHSQYFTLAGVSVMGASGVGTATDSVGHYVLKMPANDSISFSYQGRVTAKFPLKSIDVHQPLNMSLMVFVDSLPTVVVRPRSHRYDSLENRREYAKVFEYGGNDFFQGTTAGRNGGVGVGVNFDALFEGRKNRRMLAFQQRLIEEEHDKYVDHRFNKALVKKITGMASPALETFMKVYRPSYEQLQMYENDYDYYSSIRDWGKAFLEAWKQQHPYPG